MGKLWIVVIVGSLLALVGGCRKRDMCTELAARNRSCAAAFGRALVPPAETQSATAVRKAATQAVEEIRQVYTGPVYLEACRRAWLGKTQQDRELQRAAERCLRENSCEDYVRCILKLRPQRGERQP